MAATSQPWSLQSATCLMVTVRFKHCGVLEEYSMSKGCQQHPYMYTYKHDSLLRFYFTFFHIPSLIWIQWKRRQDLLFHFKRRIFPRFRDHFLMSIFSVGKAWNYFSPRDSLQYLLIFGERFVFSRSRENNLSFLEKKKILLKTIKNQNRYCTSTLNFRRIQNKRGFKSKQAVTRHDSFCVKVKGGFLPQLKQKCKCHNQILKTRDLKSWKWI